jgi:quinol monooxygenase YgiN
MSSHTQTTVALYAEFTAQEGKAEEVQALLLDLTTEVRNEPGNIIFDPHRSKESPNDFFVYEIYRDQEAFDTHIGADYGKVFNKALTELIVGTGSTLTFLTPLQ